MTLPPVAEPFSGWQWRWLASPGGVSMVEDDLRRQAAVYLADAFAWGGVNEAVVPGKGMPRGQPVPIEALSPRGGLRVDRFRWLTEGRPWQQPSHSCCGYLPGGIYCLMGLRNEKILNRDDDNIDGVPDAREKPRGNDPWWHIKGQKAWRVGWNLTMLRQGSIDLGCWQDARRSNRVGKDLLPQMGDSPLLNFGKPDEHTLVITSDLEEVAANEWSCTTTEAGQVDEGGQCVRVYQSFVRREAGQLWLSRTEGDDGRLVDGWIDVGRIPLDAPALLPPQYRLGRLAEG